MAIYAMSDIHGFIEPFEEAPTHVDLSDGAPHYYIDGQTVISGRIPVLKYDEATGTHSGPGL